MTTLNHRLKLPLNSFVETHISIQSHDDVGLNQLKEHQTTYKFPTSITFGGNDYLLRLLQKSKRTMYSHEKTKIH